MKNVGKFTDFDEFMIDRLKDPKESQAFLNASLEAYQEDKDLKAFTLALELLIKAQGNVSEFAKDSKLNRSHLYSIFKNEGKPQFDTVLNILLNLGFQLSVKPLKKRRFAH
jgi:probable addiction module antidote protein